MQFVFSNYSPSFNAMLVSLKSDPDLSLYPRYTTDEAVLMLMDIYVGNRNVSKKLRGEIASLIHALLPRPNNFPSTKYLLLKYVNEKGPTYSPINHLICKQCESYVGVQQSNDKAPCKACQSTEMSSLYMFPLEEIVKHLFEVRELAKDLSSQAPSDGVYSRHNGWKYL